MAGPTKNLMNAMQQELRGGAAQERKIVSRKEPRKATPRTAPRAGTTRRR